MTLERPPCPAPSLPVLSPTVYSPTASGPLPYSTPSEPIPLPTGTTSSVFTASVGKARRRCAQSQRNIRYSSP